MNNPVCRLLKDMAALLSSSLATVIYCKNDLRMHNMVYAYTYLTTRNTCNGDPTSKDSTYASILFYNVRTYLCVSCVVVFLSTTRVPTVKGLLLISSLSPWTTIVFSASYCCCSSVTFDIHDCSRARKIDKAQLCYISVTYIPYACMYT